MAIIVDGGACVRHETASQKLVRYIGNVQSEIKSFASDTVDHISRQASSFRFSDLVPFHRLIKYLIAANPPAHYDFERLLPASGVKRLNLSHRKGVVRVTGSEGDSIAIRAINREAGSTCKTEAELLGDTVKVTTDRNFYDFEPCEVDVMITLPRSVSIDGKIGAGTFDAVDIAGDLAVDLGMGVFRGAVRSSNVRIKMGVGHLDLRWIALPQHGTADINAGMTDTTLEFPRGSTIDPSVVTGYGSFESEVATDKTAGMKVKAKVGLARFQMRYAD